MVLHGANPARTPGYYRTVSVPVSRQSDQDKCFARTSPVLPERILSTSCPTPGEGSVLVEFGLRLGIDWHHRHVGRRYRVAVSVDQGLVGVPVQLAVQNELPIRGFLAVPALVLL